MCILRPVSPFPDDLPAAPLTFVLNWLIYRIMLQPAFVKRAKSRGQLETDSILATFRSVLL